MTDESLFAEALAIGSPAERAAYLDRACAGNPALRAEVQALLDAHAASNPLDQPPADVARTGAYAPERVADPDEAVGAILAGKYKLLELLGTGGMGAVYMAQQTEPVKRLVAVKVIRDGMDSRQVLARFEAERQALALMDHPNIAKVFDAGTTDRGRPFFVMELVKGVPITEFCDARRLSPRERLELFVPVCQAIQHAHQKGVIHRDIKPSNVLVALYDGRPVPKVIDFGVAKAAGQPLTDMTLVTGFGAIVGTPEYMSPEQAELNQLDIDTRSDVFALGVLLYELLTGSTPLNRTQLGKAALLEVLRIVREVEPPKPSTRVSTSDARASIAANRNTDPVKLSKLMRGELDWIVMKALEKDRNRRYESATALAKDVERHLRGDAVEACPPTLGYRLRKAYRRNRAAVLVTAAFVGVICGAAVVGGLLAVQATRAGAAAALRRAEAEREREAADAERVRAAGAEQRAVRDAAQVRRLLEIGTTDRTARAWLTGDFRRAEGLFAELSSRTRHTESGFERRLLERVFKPRFTRLDGVRATDALCWHPDGTRVACLDISGLIVADARTGKVAYRVPLEHGFGCLIAYSPDGSTLAIAEVTTNALDALVGRVVLRDSATGAVRRTIDQPHPVGHGLAFSPNGMWIAAGPHLFDAATGDRVRTFNTGGAPVNAVAFAPSSNRLYHATGHLVPRVVAERGPVPEACLLGWIVTNGKQVFRAADLEVYDWVGVLADGRRAVASGRLNESSRLHVYEALLGTGTLLWSRSGVGSAVSPCGRWIAGTYMGTRALLDATDGRPMLPLPDIAHDWGPIAFSPDGTRVAHSDPADSALVTDVSAVASHGVPTGYLEGDLFHTVALEPKVGTLAFAPDRGSYAAVVGRAGERGRLLCATDADTGRARWTAVVPINRDVAIRYRPKTDELVIAMSPSDPEEGASSVTAYHARTGAARRTLALDFGEHVAFDFHPNGRVLACGGPVEVGPGGRPTHPVRLVDPDTGRELARWAGHTKPVLAVAFAPDGRGLVSRSTGEVIVWDTTTGRELARAEEHVRYARAKGLAVSPCGTKFATPCGLYELGTARLLWKLEREQFKGCESMAFSPDGTRLLTEFKWVPTLHDVETGQVVAELSTVTKPNVVAVAWSPDGTRVAALAVDNTIVLWNAGPVPEPKK